MCVGENCAPQAVHYMNAQLAALYENAADCIKHHDWSTKPAEQFSTYLLTTQLKRPADLTDCRMSEYSHALAEFTFTNPYSRNQTMFHATFGKPEIEFICNHDAILRLKIRKGYYRLDYSKSSAMNYSDKYVNPLFALTVSDENLTGTVCNLCPASSFPSAFPSIPVACVARTRRSATDRTLSSSLFSTSRVRRSVTIPCRPPCADHTGTTEAELVSAEPAIIVGRDAFVYYLTEYLVFLHNAGNHVLFSLPDFDDDRYRLTIDYSLMGGTVLEVDHIHGVSVDKINTYLSSVWLKAAMLAGGDVADWKSLCLAEYRTTWRPMADGDDHFVLRLGAPRVKPVCSREAIVYFTVDEVLFFDDADFTK